MSGPFAHVVPADALPEAFHAQFLSGDVVLTGTMDDVWHRPRWISPLLRLVARWNVLFPETGRGVPAELRITRRGETDAWRRRFEFPRLRRFDAELAWDAQRHAVVERTGPFELLWDVRFRGPQRIEIRTRGGAVRVLGRRVPLPRALVPDVRATEHACARDRVHVELVVSQRPLGAIFGYAGTFEVRPS